MHLTCYFCHADTIHRLNQSEMNWHCSDCGRKTHTQAEVELERDLDLLIERVERLERKIKKEI